MMFIGAAVLFLALLAIVLVLVGTVRSKVPPMPTSAPVKRVMFSMMPAHINGTVYELGAGWGGLAVALARRYPDRPVIAVEISPLPWLVSRLRARLSGLKNLTVRYGDALKLDLADAGLIVCYLCPDVMAPLQEKLAAELPAGACVVSNTFALSGWQPSTAQHAEDLHRSPVYLYDISGKNAPSTAERS